MRCGQPTIQFLVYQSGVFQQADHLSPDDLIKEFLSDEAAIVANRPAEFPPTIGANALVVVNLTCTGLRRCSGERIATLGTADQSLHHAGRDGTPARSYFVVVEQLLSTGEAFFRHQGWYGNLDPLFARAFVACCSAGRSYTQPTLWAHNPRPGRGASLAEAGEAAIGWVPQQSPDYRAFPAVCLASRDSFTVELSRDLPDAESLHCVHLINVSHYTGFGFINDVGGGRLVGFTNIAVSIRSVAHDTHFAQLRSMSLTAPGTFQDLCAFIFRDHALKLNQELIFRAVALWRLHEPGLDSMAGELLDQQNLVRVLATQSVWRIREHNLDLSFGGEITHTLQAWPLQRRSAVAFIFEHPLSGHFQIVALGKLDQRRRLARNRVLLALLLGGTPRIDRRHSHIQTPSRVRRRSAHDMGPESRKPAQASTRASDQTNRKHQLENGRSFYAAQPCLFRVRRNAFKAAVTIAPMVRPLLFAYFLSSSAVRGGSFKVTDTVASGISMGRSSWEASSK